MVEREKILASLELSERRMKHTLGVEEAAIELAARYCPQIGREEVSAAALLHDSTKELSDAEQLELCDRLGITLTAQERMCVRPLHGLSAAELARRRFGLPERVLSAIRRHSTLCADYTPFDAVLFLADYTEKNRTSFCCVRCREYYGGLYAAGDKFALEKALLFGLDGVIAENLDRGGIILEDTFQARNAVIYKLKGAGK